MTPETSNVAEEAIGIVHGPRQDNYGHPRDNFRRIAAGFSVVFGVDITERQVALAMMWLKIARDVNKPHRDNLVDVCGYALTAEMLDADA